MVLRRTTFAKISAALLIALAFSVLLSALPTGSAQAQTPFWFNGPKTLVWHGNDTGGIIPWSCENEAAAQAAAADYCAMWRKYPRITGVNRQYGDYISFNCLWTPYINRDALPAVRTRNASCAGEPPRLLTK